jgi:hypothetical protein
MEDEFQWQMESMVVERRHEHKPKHTDTVSTHTPQR